jgi:hypothetical protein
LQEHDNDEMADAPSDGDLDAFAALTFGGRARAFRVEAGLSVAELAAEVGVPLACHPGHRIRPGLPAVEDLARMAKALWS